MADVPQIYLASQSPRRRDLLAQLHIHFLTLDVQISEIPQPDENAYDFAKRMAISKAKAGWQHHERRYHCPVLGADTIVVLNKQLLGKPRDKQHAIAMLTQLSNNTHEVITAVALITEQKEVVEVSVNEVTFRALSNVEIETYWATGEPQDKAGAYAIQGLGAIFVSNLKGSYSGVMGLPLFETAKILNNSGITVLA